MFFIYVLQSERSGRYYIGSTSNVANRVEQHNSGMTRATRNLRPWHLVHTESYETLAQARKRESQIKSWKNRDYMRNQLGLPR